MMKIPSVKSQKKEGIDFIITNNVRNFRNSTNTIYSPIEALEIIDTFE
jgi:hypothetical protein